MSDGVHLLIPFAYSHADGCAKALGELALPHLERLLARLTLVDTDSGDETSLSMPHERVLAREVGLSAPDGLIPWAAWQVKEAGRDPLGAAWARITPCHWRVATDHISMGQPQDLQLDATESQALLAAMRPFFEEDGIMLEYDAPTLWLARGEVFRDLATASLDRVVGRTIDDWIPRAQRANTVRRLQQEMQMLLYTHEVNEARTRGGQLPVNSFWVSGTGALPDTHRAPHAVMPGLTRHPCRAGDNVVIGAIAGQAPNDSPVEPPGLQITHYLRDAALIADWPAWAAAWQAIDVKECARLAKRLDAGEKVTITLCGERNAQTWSVPTDRSWMRRMSGLFRRKSATALLESL